MVQWLERGTWKQETPSLNHTPGIGCQALPVHPAVNGEEREQESIVMYKYHHAPNGSRGYAPRELRKPIKAYVTECAKQVH